MTKTKTLTLTRHRVPDCGTLGVKNEYRVEKITDSTDFLPGEGLSQQAVDSLCLAKYWKVTIVAAK